MHPSQPLLTCVFMMACQRDQQQLWAPVQPHPALASVQKLLCRWSMPLWFMSMLCTVSAQSCALQMVCDPGLGRAALSLLDPRVVTCP